MNTKTTQFGSDDQQEAADAKGKPATPAQPKIHLHDCKAIRKEMARVYRESRAGIIEVATGSKLIHMLGVLVKTHEISVIEERIKALEGKAGA